MVRQAVEAVMMAPIDAPRRELLVRRLLRVIEETSWYVTPVAISQRLHRIIRQETGAIDLYGPLKERMNRTALDLLPVARAFLKGLADPREALVRLAIAGNLLDAGAENRVTPEEFANRFGAIWRLPMVGNPLDLFQAATRAKRILYLADNAGEIVFDRLLIEGLPIEKIVVAVRGSPIINDATLEDASVAGLLGLIPVITNGSDAPGTLLDECSDEFRVEFDRTDLIIAKGQGNYETLCKIPREMFFLLTVKCRRVAEAIGAPQGALVVKHSAEVRGSSALD